MSMIDRVVEEIKKAKSILVLTGAGLSADSGIPTFRGEEGIWVKGSKNYYPEEMARYSSFMKTPETIWEWYKYRQEICSRAEFNHGHKAIAQLEEYCEQNGKEFLLVTQNVDDLHRRAGSKRMVEIHGNIFKMRCSSRSEHSYRIVDLSDDLSCPTCGAIMRPHVLWFDEYYDQELFSIPRIMRATEDYDILLVIGTTLQTTMPYQIVSTFYRYGKPIVEINPAPVLGDQIELVVAESSTTALPAIISKLK